MKPFELAASSLPRVSHSSPLAAALAGISLPPLRARPGLANAQGARNSNKSNLIRAVWNKGWPILGRDPSRCRTDYLGNRIEFEEYGNRNSKYGWELHHHPVPAAAGGSDDIRNLVPLHWRDNVRLGAQTRLSEVLRGG